MRKFIAAFTTIATLAAVTYAQSLEKAAKRSMGVQQTEDTGAERNG